MIVRLDWKLCNDGLGGGDCELEEVGFDVYMFCFMSSLFGSY